MKCWWGKGGRSRAHESLEPADGEVAGDWSDIWRHFPAWISVCLLQMKA